MTRAISSQGREVLQRLAKDYAENGAGVVTPKEAARILKTDSFLKSRDNQLDVIFGDVGTGPDAAVLRQIQQQLENQALRNPALRKPAMSLKGENFDANKARLIRDPYQGVSPENQVFSKMRLDLKSQTIPFSSNRSEAMINEAFTRGGVNNNSSVEARARAITKDFWENDDKSGKHIFRMEEINAVMDYTNSLPPGEQAGFKQAFYKEMANYITNPRNGLDAQFVMDSLLGLHQSTDWSSPDNKTQGLERFVKELGEGMASKSPFFSGRRPDPDTRGVVIGNYDGGLLDNDTFGSMALVRDTNNRFHWVEHETGPQINKTKYTFDGAEITGPRGVGRTGAVSNVDTLRNVNNVLGKVIQSLMRSLDSTQADSISKFLLGDVSTQDLDNLIKGLEQTLYGTAAPPEARMQAQPPGTLPSPRIQAPSLPPPTVSAPGTAMPQTLDGVLRNLFLIKSELEQLTIQVASGTPINNLASKFKEQIQKLTALAKQLQNLGFTSQAKDLQEKVIKPLEELTKGQATSGAPQAGGGSAPGGAPSVTTPPSAIPTPPVPTTPPAPTIPANPFALRTTQSGELQTKGLNHLRDSAATKGEGQELFTITHQDDTMHRNLTYTVVKTKDGIKVEQPELRRFWSLGLLKKGTRVRQDSSGKLNIEGVVGDTESQAKFYKAVTEARTWEELDAAIQQYTEGGQTSLLKTPEGETLRHDGHKFVNFDALNDAISKPHKEDKEALYITHQDGTFRRNLTYTVVKTKDGIKVEQPELRRWWSLGLLKKGTRVRQDSSGKLNIEGVVGDSESQAKFYKAVTEAKNWEELMNVLREMNENLPSGQKIVFSQP